MKDTLKFAGATFLMLATLVLINMVFVQSLMGDYDWLNLLLTVVYTALVLAAAVYDGLNRGAKDCKFTALMEKQKNLWQMTGAITSLMRHMQPDSHLMKWSIMLL